MCSGKGKGKNEEFIEERWESVFQIGAQSDWVEGTHGWHYTDAGNPAWDHWTGVHYGAGWRRWQSAQIPLGPDFSVSPGPELRLRRGVRGVLRYCI